ncbi:MAG: DNA-processing protein DprA [Bacteroidales bacterium]|jgi:DNA processing protein|nr:DNA-processing protein DprA [Bacteroidales bacterium]
MNTTSTNYQREEELFSLLTLSQIPKIGCKLIARLVQHFGSASEVLKASPKNLTKIANISDQIANFILSEQSTAKAVATKEIEYCNQNAINIIMYNEPQYSNRLRKCNDAPPFLFTKGNFNLNTRYIVSVVGTRLPTEYGRKNTVSIIEDLAKFNNVMIISGLAAGIDTLSHQTALRLGLPTIGVLGHGLKTMYPVENKKLSLSMQENGGIITEFFADTVGEPCNFPRRNRIIAGLSDAVIIIEARKKGGALITANVAFSYDRDVFAVPGRSTDKASEGCNNLIKYNKAGLLTCGNDLIEQMKWENKNENTTHCNKTNYRPDMDTFEQQIYSILQNVDQMNIDQIAITADLEMATLSAALLSMEFKGYVECLPGKRYKIVT